MADIFTKDVSQPGLVSGSVATHDSTAAAIGAGLGGLAQILDVGLKASSEARKDRVVAGLDKTLADEAQRFGEQGAPSTSLVGEASSTAQTAATSSPAVQSHANDIAKLEAANGQGRMSREEFLARVSARTSAAVAENPRFAKELRAHAQEVLGVNPTAAMINLQLEEQKSAVDVQRAATQQFITSAVSNGVGFLDENGTIDVHRTVQGAQTFLQTEAKMKAFGAVQDAKIKELQIANLQRGDKKEPTLEETRAIRVTGALESMDPLYQDMTDGAISRLDATIKANANLDAVGQQTRLMTDIGRTKSMFMNNLEQNMSKAGLDDDERKRLRANYEARFKLYEDATAGGFSPFQNFVNMSKQLTARGEVKGWQIAPKLSQAKVILGDQALGSVVGVAINDPAASAARVDLMSEVNNVFKADAITPLGIVHNVAGIGAGEITLGQLPDDNHRRATIRGSIAAIQSYSTRPNELQANELNALGNHVNELAKAALPSEDPDNLRAASSNVSGPAVLRAFDRFAADPDNGAKAQEVGANTLALVSKSALKNMQTLKATSTGVEGQPGPLGATTGGGQVQFTPVYNPETGQVEITPQFPAVVGPAAALPPIPTALLRRVQNINQDLNAAGHLKDYGTDMGKNMTPEQMKQYIASGSGIAMKPGTQPLDMPNAKVGVPQAETRVPGKVGDMIDQVAGDEGLDPAIAHAFAMEESSGNTNPKDAGAGAKGLFQLLPATAKELGVNPDTVSGNILGGVRYIKQMMDQFGGDVEKAAVAYIAGPANVDAYMANPKKFPATFTGVKNILKTFGMKPSTPDKQVNLKVVE